MPVDNSSGISALQPEDRDYPLSCVVVCTVRTGGGVTEAFIASLAMLKNSGVKILAVIPQHAHYELRVREQCLDVICVSRLERKSLPDVIRQSVIIAWLARKANAQLIIVHNGRLVRAIKRLLSSTPLLAICHGGKLERFLHADRIITVNPSLRESLIRLGYPPNQSAVVGNVLPLVPRLLKAPRNDPAEEFTVGTLALLEPSKGLDTLIEAAHILSKRGKFVYGRIAGIGSEEIRLRKRLQDLDLAERFKLIGWTDDRIAFLDSLDVYVQPSRMETFGIGILEAFACGVPTIATACEGPKLLIKQNETGVIVPIDDPISLAQQIERLIGDRQLRYRLAQNAYTYCIDHFTIETVMPKFMREVHAAIDSHRRTHELS